MKLVVVLAHLWSSDVFPTSTTTDRAAALRREKEEGQIRQRDISRKVEHKLTSLVLEHFGRWGK